MNDIHFDENSLYLIIFLFLKKMENNVQILENVEKNIEKGSIIFIKKMSVDYFKLFKNDEDYNNILDFDSMSESDRINLIKEKNDNFSEIRSLSDKIRNILLYDSNQNILVEIRPGTGGIEASIFAKDLYDMYLLFSKKMDWNLKMTESRIDKNGNLSLFSFLIEGKDVFLWMKNEAGVHRVQRIPKTESKGRLHTSTATVVILPEFKEVEMNIPSQDLKIDTCRSSGAGGQHVNTTDSAVRITHIPTGIVVYSQDGRSQHSNKAMAMSTIKIKVLEKKKKENMKEKDYFRSIMIGDSERSERIRTYNWQQNRVTDHRLKKSWEIRNFLYGDLYSVCQLLIEYEFKKRILDLEKGDK